MLQIDNLYSLLVQNIWFSYCVIRIYQSWKLKSAQYLSRRVYAQHREFGGNETTLYDSIMMDPCHYVFFKTHGIYNTKSES